MHDTNKRIILPSGSIEGVTFSKVSIEYPRPKPGQETFAQYHQRVQDAVEDGFHLGDLSWPDYTTYCKGSGVYEGANCDDTI